MTATDGGAGAPIEPIASTARRRGLSLRVAAVLGVIHLLSLGGAAAWAVTTNNDLEATRASLAATQGDLETTDGTLSATEADLADATSGLAAERAKIDINNVRITTLEFQIERKAACIESQTTNLVEFRRILALERENFGRTSSGSAWAKAVAASGRALDLAIDYLAKAYSSAAAGSYGTANNWISKSNAQIKVSNKQIDISNAQIKSVNAASDAINAANEALGTTLDATTSTCGG